MLMIERIFGDVQVVGCKKSAPHAASLLSVGAALHSTVTVTKRVKGIFTSMGWEAIIASALSVFSLVMT